MSEKLQANDEPCLTPLDVNFGCTPLEDAIAKQEQALSMAANVIDNAFEPKRQPLVLLDIPYDESLEIYRTIAPAPVPLWLKIWRWFVK